MPMYVIERGIPKAGELTPEQLRSIAQQSCAVVEELDTDYEWQQSYVTDDHIYCIHVAPSEEVIREHAIRGGFPADRILEVHNVIDPTTAEG